PGIPVIIAQQGGIIHIYNIYSMYLLHTDIDGLVNKVISNAKIPIISGISCPTIRYGDIKYMKTHKNAISPFICNK
ncbi:MAG: hypothetical protein IKA45_06455, partial [Bacteroidales bacterium]|nr:hypothetical protein [Bacteroidales bacterium]